MQNELKEKLQNLSEKFNTDLDVISLKALCSVPENEEILFAITGTLNRLIEKYPDDEEILGLLPKKEKISLENLIEVLQETYPSNVEVFTIKALSTFPEEELREKAIAQSLERLLEVNPNDENILEYLSIENIVPKEQNPDMVFVEGSSYTPSFFNEERSVIDLYVNKYQTTQEEWEKYMRKNPSKFKGSRRPVESITWIDTLVFCNKMSENYGLQPAYKIENDKLVKIIYKDGKEEYPNLADFLKVEGYRLPTEIEWEWFARGGKVAQEKGTFDTKYAGSDNLDEVAWYGENSDLQTHSVGNKKANELGLYDCTGNICEYCYDRYNYYKTKTYLEENRAYIYEENYSEALKKGGYYLNSPEEYWVDEPEDGCSLYNRNGCGDSTSGVGFRIVRTANPQK